MWKKTHSRRGITTLFFFLYSPVGPSSIQFFLVFSFWDKIISRDRRRRRRNRRESDFIDFPTLIRAYSPSQLFFQLFVRVFFSEMKFYRAIVFYSHTGLLLNRLSPVARNFPSFFLTRRFRLPVMTTIHWGCIVCVCVYGLLTRTIKLTYITREKNQTFNETFYLTFLFSRDVRTRRRRYFYIYIRFHNIYYCIIFV